MTIGALGYLVAFGDMNLLSAGVAVEVARLLSAFTGLGGHVGSPSARRVSRLIGPFAGLCDPGAATTNRVADLELGVGAISGNGWPKGMTMYKDQDDDEQRSDRLGSAEVGSDSYS